MRLAHVREYLCYCDFHTRLITLSFACLLPELKQNRPLCTLGWDCKSQDPQHFLDYQHTVRTPIPGIPLTNPPPRQGVPTTVLLDDLSKRLFNATHHVPEPEDDEDEERDVVSKSPEQVHEKASLLRTSSNILIESLFPYNTQKLYNLGLEKRNLKEYGHFRKSVIVRLSCLGMPAKDLGSYGNIPYSLC